MCIEAPESTTNSLSPGLKDDGTTRHQTSEGENKNALFCYMFPVNVNTLLAMSHASLRAHRSHAKGSSWVRSSNFGAEKLPWAKVGWIPPSDGFLSRFIHRGLYSFWRKSNTSTRFQWIGALPRNRSDFRRLRILKYTSKLLHNPNKWDVFLSSTFLCFLRLSVRLPVRDWTLFAKLATWLWFIILTHGRVPKITRWVRAIAFEVISARLLGPFPDGLLPLGGPSLRWNYSHRSLSAILERERKNGYSLHVFWNRGENWKHLLFVFHWLQSPCFLSTLTAFPLLLLFASVPSTVLSFLTSKMRSLIFWSRNFFTMDLNLR